MSYPYRQDRADGGAGVARESARQANGEFGIQPAADVSTDVELTPVHAADGSLNVDALVKAGRVEGFDQGIWPEPRTMTLAGHWDGNTIVVESFFEGSVLDARNDDGHWSEGLWASSATGSSEAEIAAAMIEEYEECDDIRVATDDEDYTPDPDEDEED